LFSNNCAPQFDDSIQIEYKATTRGTSLSIRANSTEISYSHNEDSSKIDLSKSQWNEIEKIISAIKLKEINKLTAPSTGSHADRALAANLTITKNGTVYKSPKFDHGNPPAELKKLTDMLFKLVDQDSKN
jgi:mannose/cellobiose epimerase-like protein (N-acyl-D-glucosamine 2-epimerase family)